jgi:ParB-like chromosome segregation protein Spo0J
MDALTPPTDFDALRRAIEEAGQDAMNPDAENRQALFERAILNVLDLRNNAMAIYSRQVRNPEARRKAHKIRRHAERKIGELLIAAARAGLRYIHQKTGKIGPASSLITLEKLGITRKQSQTWQKLARMSDAEFEAWIEAELIKKSQRRSRRANTDAQPGGAGALPIRHTSAATMSIGNIKIGARHRKDMGDIEGLAASISDVGLLHPIVVKADGTLIAGGRRLEAYKLLSRTDVPVTLVDLADIVRGELAENAERKDFLPSEIEAIRRELEPIEKAAAKERQGSRNDLREIFPEVGEQRVRDKIGALAGVSGRTVEKIAVVVAAAEAEPTKYGHLVEEMDKTGKVDRAHRQLRNKGEDQRRTPRKPKRTRAVNDAPDDVAQPDLPFKPVPEPVIHEPVKDAPAARDLAPEPNVDVVPPTAPDQPAHPPVPSPQTEDLPNSLMKGAIDAQAAPGQQRIVGGPIIEQYVIRFRSLVSDAMDELQGDEVDCLFAALGGALTSMRRATNGSDAIDVAIESATPIQEEMPPSPRGVTPAAGQFT